MSRRLFAALFCILVCRPSQGFGVEFDSVTVAGKRVTVCRVNLKQDHLALFLDDDAGNPLKSFAWVDALLAKSGRRLAFAMNAGMYQDNLAPVGLFVSDGRQLSPLNLATGAGNFFMKPNGVFLVTNDGARIVPSHAYPAIREPVILATQSGPMLVEAGKINPLFSPGSKSRLIRNGVGVASPDRVIFAISEDPVNFYEFALVFRDMLGCPNALYLDGTISSLFDPQAGRHDRKADLGPMIGVVQ
jgi:uncharacterized protein YigE (DUF2233 family)